MAFISQIQDMVNDAVAEALGKEVDVEPLLTNDFVSLGKAISYSGAYEAFYSSLVNRIVKTIYFVRTYEGSNRSVLRDESEYGAFVQKVYYKLPEATDNPTFEVKTSSGYKQASPYDVENVVAVTSILFGKQGTWTIEIIRPEEQIKTAFLNESSMMAFIDGIYLTVENAMKLEEERLVAMAVNTSIANSLTHSKARNLLAEYNTKNPNATLTVAECLTNADFLKYATKEINRTIKNMSKMSTLFNVGGYETFTTTDNLVVEMLSEFASATATYLQADTFHKELVALPKYEEVPFWQASGASFDFADCSKINIINDDVIADDGLPGPVKQSGIICFLHDVENVAAYFGNRKSWEVYNPRSEVMIHGEKARKGFAVDSNANSFVFYIAEAQ